VALPAAWKAAAIACWYSMHWPAALAEEWGLWLQHLEHLDRDWLAPCWCRSRPAA
jgi:hypothetical protein